MKTILYQPLFINPQAYFVFPQLYHIERGDSYIESANITGQLIINDLTQSLTSTPILNVVQDTNQVDFGLFKGKHIRISQYTNIGAVVLGEWYIPGTPTPPEPEQPDWFKESIVAWYSPYCKQGMTNYDVIESYAEDFNSNNWKHTNNVTVTNNSFHLTYGNLTYELYPITTYNTKSMTVIVKGLNGIKGFIKYRYGQKDYVDINKDGIYYLPAKIDDANVLGFQTHFKSECDITITQLPTSILKDFSGNGNHAYLYGGKGKLNSGMGLYKVDFTSWRKSSVQTEVKPDVVKVTPNTSNYLFVQYASSAEIPSYKIKVIGLGDNVLKYQYATENGRKEINIVEGENELPTSIKVSNDYQIGYRLTPGTSVFTITQIPDYPDQLCYDDKMYAVAYDMPILTDYTVIAERTWFEKKGAFIVKGSSPNNGFVFERIDGNLERVQSLGAWNTITINTDSVVSYLTKNKYNNSNIKNGIGVDEDVLCIGGSYQKETNNINVPFIGCHGNILLFNRSLTEYEISWVKNNMMCSKQQEPDIDL